MVLTASSGNVVSTKRRILEPVGGTTSSQRPKHLGRVVKHGAPFRLIRMIVSQTNGGDGRTWTSILTILEHPEAGTAHIAVAWIFSGAWTAFEQTVRDLLDRDVRVVVHLGENLHLQHTPRNVLEGLMSLNQEFEGQFEAYVVETPSAVFHTKAYWVLNEQGVLLDGYVGSANLSRPAMGLGGEGAPQNDETGMMISPDLDIVGQEASAQMLAQRTEELQAMLASYEQRRKRIDGEVVNATRDGGGLSDTELLERMGDENEAVRQHAVAMMEARHRRRQAKNEQQRAGRAERREARRLARAVEQAEEREEETRVALVVHDRRSAVAAAEDGLERRLHHQLYYALDQPTHPSTYDVAKYRTPEGGAQNYGTLRFSVAIMAAFLADLESDAERERLLQIMLNDVRVRGGQLHLAHNREANYTDFTTRFRAWADQQRVDGRQMQTYHGQRSRYIILSEGQATPNGWTNVGNGQYPLWGNLGQRNSTLFLKVAHCYAREVYGLTPTEG